QPASPLFPYTTLFRSQGWPVHSALLQSTACYTLGPFPGGRKRFLALTGIPIPPGRIPNHTFTGGVNSGKRAPKWTRHLRRDRIEIGRASCREKRGKRR